MIDNGFTSYVSSATKTATIAFKHKLIVFDNDEEQLSVPSDHGEWSRNLIFDIHFRGFAPPSDLRAGEQQLK